MNNFVITKADSYLCWVVKNSAIQKTKSRMFHFISIWQEQAKKVPRFNHLGADMAPSISTFVLSKRFYIQIQCLSFLERKNHYE
ncbi:MAG: hypothetical protein LBB53_04835 [Prevotellaceae bacterium]|nr:hypothetical protein [Prevotellaceae bacterium]